MALLPLPEPYDFALSTERFRAFGPDLANLWHEDGLHRVVAGRAVRIVAAPGGVDVEPLDAETEPVVRRLLGEPFDLDGFAAFAAARGGPIAGLAARLRGLRPPLAPDPFEALVTSITAQQVSLFAAFAVRNRLVAAYGAAPAGGFVPRATQSPVRAFPRPEDVARASEDDLVGLGFSRRKADYVLGLARAPHAWAGLAALPDDEVKARLTGVRGLGEWTADWFLARHLARPRAWPAGDLGLRKAVAAFYGDVADVRAFGATFDPFQNLAAHYLLVGLRIP